MLPTIQKISLRRRIVHRRRGIRSSGMAVLEMCLVLFLLLSLCFGTIEFGYMYFVKNTLETAAREGARAGIVAGATNTTITAAVLAQLQAAGLISATATTISPYTLETDKVTVSGKKTTLTATDISAMSTGDNVEVLVKGMWGTVGAGFRPYAIIPANKYVTGTAIMVKEGG